MGVGYGEWDFRRALFIATLIYRAGADGIDTIVTIIIADKKRSPIHCEINSIPDKKQLATKLQTNLETVARHFNGIAACAQWSKA